MAGHKKCFSRINNHRVAKITSTVETRFYEEYGDRLRGIIPEHYPVSTEVIQSLRPHQKGKQIIELQNLLGNIVNPIIFDIKIGESTSSYDEVRNTKSLLHAIFKTIKMTLADWATGSRSLIPGQPSRGWRLIPQKGQGNRGKVGWYSESTIKRQLSSIDSASYSCVLHHVINGLVAIQEKVLMVNITFVAASVFIVIDPSNPDNTTVKLIDFAHPIKQNEPSYEVYRKNFMDGLAKLLRFFRELR